MTAYLFVLYDSQNKDNVFSYRTTAGSFFIKRCRVFTARYCLTFYTTQCNLSTSDAVPLLRKLIANIQQRRTDTSMKTFHPENVMDKSITGPEDSYRDSKCVCMCVCVPLAVVIRNNVPLHIYSVVRRGHKKKKSKTVNYTNH